MCLGKFSLLATVKIKICSAWLLFGGLTVFYVKINKDTDSTVTDD